MTSSGAVLLITEVGRPNGIITSYNVYVNSTLVRIYSFVGYLTTMMTTILCDNSCIIHLKLYVFKLVSMYNVAEVYYSSISSIHFG